MSSHHGSLNEYQLILKKLETLKESEQISILKYQWMNALLRLEQWQERATSFERSLNVASSEGASLREQYIVDTRRLHDTITAWEGRGASLESICRSLLQTIERSLVHDEEECPRTLVQGAT